MVGEFNFFSSSNENDKDLFFGPLDEEEFINIEEKDIMAHLMVKAGIFNSVSDARRNGWDKLIPKGFTDLRVGKKKIRITIFKE